jgi:hypothetical protein
LIVKMIYARMGDLPAVLAANRAAKHKTFKNQ